MSPEEVIQMPLADFEKMFGFRPVDAFEKKWFAITGKRADDTTRAFAMLMGVD
jgi:hypothetical protein